MARALSQDSIHRRFMGVVPRDVAVDELSREIRAGTDEVAFVAEGADGTILGEAYATLLNNDCAEAAFVVADRSQHHGIGTMLFGAVVGELAARGVHTMRIETLAQNTEMLGLVSDSKLAYTQQRLDDTVVMTLRIPAGAEITAPAT